MFILIEIDTYLTAEGREIKVMWAKEGEVLQNNVSGMRKVMQGELLDTVSMDRSMLAAENKGIWRSRWLRQSGGTSRWFRIDSELAAKENMFSTSYDKYG